MWFAHATSAKMCVWLQGLQRKSPSWCSPWTTSVELVTYQKKNLPECSGFISAYLSVVAAAQSFLCRVFFTPLIDCRSFIELSNGALSKKQAEDGIKAMMQAAGFDDKENISWADFHFLLKDHEKELQFAQLNVKGWRKFKLGFVLSLPWLWLFTCVCVCVCAGVEKQEKKRLSQYQRVSFICPANR